MTEPRDPFIVRQEPDQLDRRRLALSGGVMVLAFGIGLVAAGAILRAGEAGRDRGPTPPPPPQATVETTLLRGAARGIALREQQRASLDRYGWVDRDAGRAHIPIERAMDLLVEREASSDAGRDGSGVP